MKKIQKGRPGYFKYRKLQTGIAMLTGYLLVLLLFFTGIFLFADRRNLLTAGAIIAMLPTAKMTVNFLMYPRKGQAVQGEYDELCALAGNIEILADILITPEKKNVELAYTAVSRSHVIFYCTDKKLDTAYHGNFIRNFLKGSGLSVDVSFYNDLDKFKKRLLNLKVNEPEEYTGEEKERIDNIAYNLKILSI